MYACMRAYEAESVQARTNANKQFAVRILPLAFIPSCSLTFDYDWLDFGLMCEKRRMCENNVDE